MFLLPWTDLLTTFCATRTGIYNLWMVQNTVMRFLIQTNCQLVLFPDFSPTLSYMMKTGEEPGHVPGITAGG